jgi:hypothetical protein
VRVTWVDVRLFSAILVLGLVAIASPARAAIATSRAGMFTSAGALPMIHSDAKVVVDGAVALVVVSESFHTDLDRGVVAV